MVLFEQYHILHHEFSINNIMISVTDILESEASMCGPSHKTTNDSPRDDNTGDNREEALEEKLVQWDRERHHQIQSGILRSRLLIDFDYAADLNEPSPMAPGDRTVRVLSFSSPHSLIFIRGQYHLCQREYFLAIHKKGRATPPATTSNHSLVSWFGCASFTLAHAPFIRIRKSVILY